ncbi:MetQ/NlpA family ABC transporter substrate-binding protein [Xylocopilactobacillus apicola]|uniref:Methionine-binding protein n=1 Tax=Xylocopilactobacillus apicola TaxID=2932184 RepID=A0AAU9D462_9LACO|nr:MetQ/NlpA family ABC transporter substrate-binding protein [Xylocopilactobacillus apicola]BDR59646.1 methionine-binding protein [Xylocopilactobacillus apicola]
MKNRKIWLTIAAFLSVLFLATGCANQKKDTTKPEKKHTIVMGVTGGQYNDLFDKAVAPILEKEGYKIKRVNFSQFMLSNTALGEGNIDVNVAQHTAYMRIFNRDKKTDLVPLVATPSVPCSLYSSKYYHKSDLKNGMTIGIPQDPSNAARAYALLADAGWIKVNKNVKSTELAAKDVTENPHQLVIKEMDSNTIPHVLADLDFEVIPGSVVQSAKIEKKIHLIQQEKLTKDLEIVAAVRKENENKDWAKAIKRAYQSKEFKDYMKKHNEDHQWVMPK